MRGRVEPNKLRATRDDVIARGDRYRGDDLLGAEMDCDYAMRDAGFDPPEIKRTEDVDRMVVYRSRPGDGKQHRKTVVRLLEDAWAVAAFRHEAHAVTMEECEVVLDFATWWDDGRFYTGRIQVELTDDT